MKKVYLLGMQREQEMLLSQLQELGNFEVAEIKEAESTWQAWMTEQPTSTKLQQLEEAEKQISFALNLLAEHVTTKKPFLAPQPQIAEADFLAVLGDKANIIELAEKIKLLEQKRLDFGSNNLRLQAAINSLKPWISLDAPAELIRDSKRTKILLGSVSELLAADFVQDAAEIGAYLERIGEAKTENYYFIIFHRQMEEALQAIMKNYNFSKFSLQQETGTVAELTNKLGAEIAQNLQEQAAMQEEITAYTASISDLQVVFDGLQLELAKERAAVKGLYSAETFVLYGWVPEPAAEQLVQILHEKTKNIYLELSDPDEGENYPVAMHNNWFVKPYEMVTDLYSTPAPGIIDPNPPMAPFHFIFFGMMMGDFCYGVIMSVLSYVVLKRTRPKEGTMKKLLTMMFYGGFSTAFWGILFGGYFGDAGAKIFGLKPLLLDPLTQPIPMLALCFGLGLIHIFTSMAVKSYLQIKDGDLMSAVTDQGSWYLIVIGLLCLAVPAISPTAPPVIATIGKYMALFGVAWLIIFKGRATKNIIGRFFGGVLGLYDITAYMSDLLSYSRLFALGLATGVIGMVINSIAMMVSGGLGWIITILVLLGGHIFNIAINLLGAFVHASRLQYIEFYGRFFESGGFSFAPLKKDTKYYDVI